VTGIAQIEDGQTAVTQRHGAIGLDTSIIRPPALKRVGHRTDDQPIVATVSSSKDTGYSAHNPE
jgi:hypothetical protein